jgi:hypothetical protein
VDNNNKFSRAADIHITGLTDEADAQSGREVGNVLIDHGKLEFELALQNVDLEVDYENMVEPNEKEFHDMRSRKAWKKIPC